MGVINKEETNYSHGASRLLVKSALGVTACSPGFKDSRK